jgi:deoxyadenosine/deoxycytidine kinase
MGVNQMRIAISGNIGAGKSTFCSALSRETGIPVFEEPVVDNPYLGDFYVDPARWAFNAQIFMVSHRFHGQMGLPQHQSLIMDRCFQEDYVFAEVNHRIGNISDREWGTYLSLYDAMCKVAAVPDLVVYLWTTPEVALSRVRMRGRGQESEIKLEYMKEIHDSYEKWFDSMSGRTRAIRLDWNIPDVEGLRTISAEARRNDLKEL